MKKIRRIRPYKDGFGQWIPIEKKKPECLQDILVQYQNGNIDIDNIYYSGSFNYEELYGKVIAWMPLPEPYRK
ncbi:MAG: hypothetical protein KH020_10760 [Clostridiales bacterium]|nr:hypothetical protein [Clostridiales bacterium]